MREFEDLKKQEEALLAVYRKGMLPYSKGPILSLLVMPFLIGVGVYMPHLLSLFTAIMIGIFIVGVMLLKSWYLWIRSMFLITNMRVIALEQKGLFHKETQEAYFIEVCQVGTKVKGLMKSLFKYGDVLVQTQAEMWLMDIERPHEVREEILEILNLHKHNTQALPKRFWKEKSHRY